MKRLDILFVNLPTFNFELLRGSFTGNTNLSHMLAMPLGILYLSSYLKANNKNIGQVGLLDYPLTMERIKKYKSIKEFILKEAQKKVKFKPDVIAISLNFSSAHLFFKVAVKTLKKLWPKTVVVVGGIHATNAFDNLLTKKEVDYVIRGEGEIALSQVVEQLANNKKIRVRGVFSKSDLNKARVFPLANHIGSLDVLPFPDWGLLKIKKYMTALGRRRSMAEAKKKKMATLMTTRGCPFRCSFCSAHTVHGRKVRFRSVKNIIREIKILNQKYGVTLFIPEDDLFTADQKRLLTILRAVKDLNIHGLELQFPNNLHINTTTEEIIDALIGCGTNIFNFAVESGSEYVQKNVIKKYVDLRKARDLVKLCHQKKVIARCCFVIGFPGESKKLLNETYQYMKKLEADWCVISIATPLIGSEMYQQFLDRGEIKHGEDLWEKTFFTERDFDTKEISAAELNEFKYRVNIDVNFINNVNLRNGNFDRAISLFKDIFYNYPFHIFALYGMYLAYEGKSQFKKASQMVKKINLLIATDKRAGEMYRKYGDLLPSDYKIAEKDKRRSIFLRKKILEIAYQSQSSHIGSCLSLVEILSAIYRNVALEKIKKNQNNKDRVILSKGHGALALYVVLNSFGLLDDKKLLSYCCHNSLLIGHASHHISGIEHSTGSLGHGLSVGVGMAIGLKAKGYRSHVYVVVGDGELQEGSCWEAMMLAGNLKLANFTLLIDKNNLAGLGRIDEHNSLRPLKNKLESFNFHVLEVDGHDERSISVAIRKQKKIKKPIAIICQTVKGRGVSFMENKNIWHYRPLSKKDFQKALLEIEKRASI